MYSYGILCACVWNNGKQPYAEYNFQSPLELQNAVLAGCRPEMEECPFEAVVRLCWSARDTERPPFGAIAEQLAGAGD